MLNRCLAESKRSLQYSDDLDERLKELAESMRWLRAERRHCALRRVR
jgi:predicted transcriptional regulator